MTDVLSEMINAIDKALSTKFTGKYYGIVKIVDVNAERYPATITAKRERVSPMDTWQLQIYHKLGNVLELPNEENFGREITMQQNVSMVVIATVNTGEYLIHKIARSIPQLINGSLGYAVLEDGYTISSNHAQIVAADFGAMQKERVVKNFWQIDYSLNVTECAPVKLK